MFLRIGFKKSDSQSFVLCKQFREGVKTACESKYITESNLCQLNLCKIFVKQVKNQFMDAIFVALVATFSVNGCFKGFVKSLFSLLSFILAVGLAFWLASPTAEFLTSKSFLEVPIQASITTAAENLDERFATVKFDSGEEMLQAVDESDIPVHAKLLLRSVLKNLSFEGKFTISEVLTPPLYKSAMKIIAFVLLLAVFSVLFKLVQILLTKLINLGFLRVTDKTLGFLLGAVKGLILYFILIAIMILISRFMFSGWLIGKIEGGSVSSLIYQKFGDAILKALNFLA